MKGWRNNHALLRAAPLSLPSESSASLMNCDYGNPFCGVTHRPSSIVIMETRMWSFKDRNHGYDWVTTGNVLSHKSVSNKWLNLTSLYMNTSPNIFFFLWRCGPTWAMASSSLRFLDHTQRRITVGRTPLDEWSARRRDLYLTTHNTHNRQISVSQVGFEPTISASERPQTCALDGAGTRTGIVYNSAVQWQVNLFFCFPNNALTV